MIGFYDYTIILTLMSLVSAVIGMTQAMNGRFRLAVIFLALCGLFDTFDGKVARTKKNRTDDEKLYGIQLDSLVDIVSFGVFPILICYLMGLRTVFDLVLFCVYASCGVIRLCYFNVLETNRQFRPNSEEKVYHGLPITSITVIFPLVCLFSFAVSENAFAIILRIVMLITAILFIIDFKLHKPKNWHILILSIVVGLAALATLFFSRYRIKMNHEPEEPLLESDFFTEP